MDVTSLISESGVSIGALTAATVARTLLTLVVGLVLIRVVLKLLGKALDRTERASRFKSQILSFIKTVLSVLLLFVVLESLGVKVTSFVALLSVAAFAISLALQNTLSNVAGGIMSVATQPFSVGDYVSIGGTEGTVSEIKLSRTKLTTVDNKEIIIPNAQVASATIVNFNRMGRRRIDIPVTASYDAPTADVYAALRDAMARYPQILQDPAPETHITEYGNSSIAYIARFWVGAADYWTVYFGVIESIRETFEAHNVEMTYDHLNVHMAK